jgi:hypothetical protein
MLCARLADETFAIAETMSPSTGPGATPDDELPLDAPLEPDAAPPLDGVPPEVPALPDAAPVPDEVTPPEDEEAPDDAAASADVPLPDDAPLTAEPALEPLELAPLLAAPEPPIPSPDVAPAETEGLDEGVSVPQPNPPDTRIDTMARAVRFLAIGAASVSAVSYAVLGRMHVGRQRFDASEGKECDDGNLGIYEWDTTA